MTLNSSSQQNWGTHIRASVKLSLPLIGSHLAQMLTNTTDVVMMGWYSVEGLAAVVLATSSFFLFFIVGSGFAFAVMPMAATALGADEPAQVRRSVRMGGWLVLLYGAMSMVPLLYMEQILLALGQEAPLAAIAGDYMQIAAWGIFPGLLIMLLKSFFSALERAGVVLAATLLGAGANVIFNYAFIFGNFGAPEMGAEGAALASLLTTGLACLFLVVYAGIGKDFKSFDLFRKPLRPDWPAFKEVFRLGAPIGLTMLAESGLFSGSAILVGWFGTIPLAAHGIVIQIAAIAFMIPLGVSNVATIRAGRALGRKSISDLKRSSVVVLVMGLLISSFTITCYLLFPSELVALFMNANAEDTRQIVEIGVGLVMVAAAFQLVDSMQVIALGLLRGVKDTTAPMVIAVIAYWGLGMPGGYILGFHLGYGAQGVWMGLVIGLGFAAVVLLWRYWVVLGRTTARLQGHR